MSGCLDLCCPTNFYISSTTGKKMGEPVASGGAGDMATIVKRAPEGACAFCVQLWTPVDTYNIDFGAPGMLTVDQKAILMAELAHIDFLFFENEQPLCRQDGQGTI